MVTAFFIRRRLQRSRYAGVWFVVGVIFFGELAGLILGINSPAFLGLALLWLIAEIFSFISPFPNWPKSYIRLIQICTGLFTIAVWRLVILSIMHPFTWDNGPLFYGTLVGFVIMGVLIAVLALLVRRRMTREGVS